MAEYIFAFAVSALIQKVQPTLQNEAKTSTECVVASDLSLVNHYLTSHVLAPKNSRVHCAEVAAKLLGRDSVVPEDLTTQKLLELPQEEDAKSALCDSSKLQLILAESLGQDQLAYLGVYTRRWVELLGYGDMPEDFMNDLLLRLDKNLPNHQSEKYSAGNAISNGDSDNMDNSSADNSSSSKQSLDDVSLESHVARFEATIVLLVSSVTTVAHVRRYPDLVNKYRELGNNLMLHKLYPQAVGVYTQAINASLSIVDTSVPEYGYLSQLYTNRAIAYIGLSCIVEAIDDLNYAIFFDKNFVAAWIQLGFCHLHMGRALQAIECYVKGTFIHCQTDNISLQFVKRISELVSLCEKRAKQQGLDPVKLEELVVSYTGFLAQLRDRYPGSKQMLQYGVSNEFSVIERANRNEGSILTPTVLQDVNSGTFEAAAVPMTIETTRIPRPTNATNQSPTSAAGVAAQRTNPGAAAAAAADEARDVHRQFSQTFESGMAPGLAAHHAVHLNAHHNAHMANLARVNGRGNNGGENTAGNSSSSVSGSTNTNTDSNGNGSSFTQITEDDGRTTTTRYSSSYSFPSHGNNEATPNPVRNILNDFGEMIERQINNNNNGGSVGHGNGNISMDSGNDVTEVNAGGNGGNVRTLRQALPEVAGFLGNLLFNQNNESVTQTPPTGHGLIESGTSEERTGNREDDLTGDDLD